MSVAAVRRVVSRLEPDSPPTDAELVRAIAPSGADREAAFAELVNRHGAMVLGVCRGVLADAHAAEDAFQAVFFVLARKANTIRPPGAVGGWLYGVAVRTARKAKTAAGRRQRREMAAIMSANLSEASRGRERPENALARSELRAVIDEELAALPEPHRAAIVLCDLQGKTRTEAAAELNRPEGTVAAWLSRGRKALATRLARRGVTLPAAGLLAVAAPALVSAELRTAAVGHFLGRGVSESVRALAEGVMRNLSSASTKLVATMFAVGTLLAAVTTATAWHANPESPTPRSPDPLTSATGPEPDTKGRRAIARDEPVKPAPSAWKETGTLELTGWLGGSVAYSADGKVLFVGGTNGHVCAYDTATRKPLWEYKGEEHFAALALAPGGKQLVITTKDGVRFLDATTGKAGDTLEQKGSAPLAVAYMPLDRTDPDRVIHKVIFGNAAGYYGKRWYEGAIADATTTESTSARGEQQPADAFAVPLAADAASKWVLLAYKLQRDGTNELWGWWPWRVVAKNTIDVLKKIKGRKASVVSAAWSKDNKWFVTGDVDGMVITWDAETFEEKSRAALGARGAAVALSADGKSVAAAVTRPVPGVGQGAYAEEVFVWPTTGAPEKLEPIARHEAGAPFSGIASLAFAPDGKSLVSGFANFAHLARSGGLVGKVRVFSLPEAKANEEPAAKSVWNMSFSPDGKRYVVIRGDRAEVYDTATEKIVFAVEAEAAGFVDGGKLATMGAKAVAVYDARGKLTATYPRPKTKDVWYHIAFSPDGKLFAAHFDQHVRVYDTATGFEPMRPEGQVETRGPVPVRAIAPWVAFSADGKQLRAARVKLTEDGQFGAAVWDLATGKRLLAFPVDPKAELNRLALAPNGSEIAVATMERVEVWAVGGETKKNPVRRLVSAWTVDSIAYSPSGKLIAVGTRHENGDLDDLKAGGRGRRWVVQVFNAATGKEVKRLEGPAGAAEIAAVEQPFAFSPDGTKLLVALNSVTMPSANVAEVRVVDLTAPEPVRRQWIDAAVLEDHGALVNGVAVAPGGKSFAAATAGNVTCWDTETRKVLWKTKGEAAALAYSPDGKHLVVAGKTEVTRLDAKTGKADEWADPNITKYGQATAVAYSPNGKWLAVANGWNAKAYPAEGGKMVRGFSVRETGDGPVLPCTITWSPDGKRLAVPLRSEKVGWRLALAPVELGPSDKDVFLTGSGDTITAVAWSKDGKVIASGDEKGVVILWDAGTGKELWRKHYGDGAGRIHALAISPEDNTVAMAVWLGARKSPERVVLLAAKDGGEIQHLIGQTPLPVTSLAWSGDGKFLVTGCGALPGHAVKQTEPAVGAVVVWERKP